MATAEQKSAKGKRSKGRIVVALLAGVLFAVLAWVAWGKLRTDVWTCYTDDEGTEFSVEEGEARAVLWEDPKQNSFAEQPDPAVPGAADPVNQRDGRLEAAFSPNGTMMVLVRWAGSEGDEGEAADTADIYLARWDGRVWSRPEAIAALNSPANDRGPAFSRDGRYLYFASDREGGRGGYDLYVARWDGSDWTAAESLGEPLNTATDELGPAPSADGTRLFFSSNRDGEREDIFVAAARPEPEAIPDPDPAPTAPPETAQDPLPPLPVFDAAEPVGHLNSEADDLQAALTTRGDHVFLASDRDRDDESGFRLDLSRVVAGEAQPPEKVDLYFDAGDATDPAVRMEGFDLLFSADLPDVDAEKVEDAAKRYLLYRSTTREVFGYTDYTRWEQFKELMKNIGWWILLAIAALIALIYLIEKWQDITNLFHKCLAGSAVVHLLILFLLALWQITRQVEGGGEPQSPEIAVTIDALAQEQLALESTPEEAKMTETPVALVTDRLKSTFELPSFEPKVDTRTSPIVSSSAKVSLITDVRQSKANLAPASEAVPAATKTSPALAQLTETILPEPEALELEELDPGETVKAEDLANPLADLFVPTKTLPQVETEQDAEKAEPKTGAQSKPTEAELVDTGAEVAETRDTGGDVIIAHRGLESIADAPKLEGVGKLASTMLKLPGADPEDDPLLPGEIESPPGEIDAGALTELVRKQRGKPSMETIEQLGGSDATERAIGAALEWLSRNQESDGRWDTRKHGGNETYDTASAGLALLCYYGWGQSHNRGGRYQNNIRRAIDWLLKQQKDTGDLRGRGRMYCHGIAAIALCEAYGLSGDQKLKEPAEKAIAFILSAQSKSKGGWRYGPGEDADTSVTGWQFMAMHSARMAGLEVPESAFVSARRWFDHAGGGKHGGLYGYTGPEKNKHAMIATGMFCRQLDLVAPSEPRMQESAEALSLKKLNAKSPDFYYVYYATLALYQHQGPIWTTWNEQLKETLPLVQRKDGAEAGSWDKGSAHAAAGGRVVSTTLATLSLEVYYRLLPMYGFRNKDAAPPAQVKGGE